KTDRVLDVDLKRDAGARFPVELARLGNALQNPPTQVLFDDEEHDIAMAADIEPEERLLGLQALPARTRDHGRTGGARLASGLQDRSDLRFVGQSDQQLKLHGSLLSSANSGTGVK